MVIFHCYVSSPEGKSVNQNNSQDLGGFFFLGLLALIKWDDPGNNPDKPAGARVPRRQGSHMTHMIMFMSHQYSLKTFPKICGKNAVYLPTLMAIGRSY